MTQSVTWSLVSTLLKNNLKSSVSRFIGKYNVINVRYLRKPRESIGNIDSNSSEEKLAVIQDVKKPKTKKKSPDLSVSSLKTVSTLMKTLDVTKDNALSIISECKIFQKLSKTTICDNYYLLRNADVDKSTLRVHIYALADTTSNLVAKINCIKEMKLDINSAIPLLRLSFNKLKKLKDYVEIDKPEIPEFNNRVEYLANTLGCSVNEMCSILINNKYILSIRMKKIKEVTKLLLDEGILRENLKKDLHIYKFSPETIKKRIDKAKDAGVKQLKPWVVRCPLQILDKISENNNNRRNIMNPHANLPDYLTAYFGCNKDLIDGLLKRNPRILRINVAQLSKILDFLRGKGYLIEEIYRQPQVLNYNEKTLEDRYDELSQSCTSSPPPLAALIFRRKKQIQSDN